MIYAYVILHVTTKQRRDFTCEAVTPSEKDIENAVIWKILKNFNQRKINWKVLIVKICHLNNTKAEIQVLLYVRAEIPGPLFTKKTPSYGYRDSHDKPKKVWRPSQVYIGNPYTDKYSFLSE